MEFNARPIIIDGKQFTPKSLKKVGNNYTIGGKTFKGHPELFRYDMSADIQAQLADEASISKMELNSFDEDYSNAWNRDNEDSADTI